MTASIRDRLREILRADDCEEHPMSDAGYDRVIDAIVALFADGERDRDDLIADLFVQGTYESGDDAYPLDDLCFSTYEAAARHLMAIGRLERHPTEKYHYRWLDAAKEDR